MLTVTERSTPIIVSSIAKYESATGLYNSTDGMAPITILLQQVQMTMANNPHCFCSRTILSCGIRKMYVTALTDFSITGVTVNGQPVSLSVDSDASDDGLTGLY